METVLVVGATGNIGVSVIIAALRSKLNVLALVRNQASAAKLFQHVGTKDGITVVEADVTSDDGVEKVVAQVKDGNLPSFQHVYSAVGVMNMTSPIQNLDIAAFRQNIHVSLEANFLAYRATIPYLIEQGNPNSTWTLITGGAGELGFAGVTAVSQGALFSLANVACLENAKTNIRFNEVYLCYRVDFDSVCEEEGTADRIKVSDFARVYEGILANKDIKASRVSILGPEDIKDLKYKEKLAKFKST